MNRLVRTLGIWGGILLLVGVLLVALHYLAIAKVLKSAPITSECNASDTNMIRSSYIAFEYAQGPDASNLSNFMNATCLHYQSVAIGISINNTGSVCIVNGDCKYGSNKT